METGRFIYKSISVGATQGILGDPGADSRGEGKSKRAENKARRKVKNGSSGRSLLFFCAIFFRLFRVSLAPTICPWVSEDVLKATENETEFYEKEELQENSIYSFKPIEDISQVEISQVIPLGGRPANEPNQKHDSR